MKKMLALLAVVVVLSAGLSMAQPSDDLDFSGVYSVEGTRPDGELYRGIVEIVRHEATYRLRWTFSAADQQYGIGVVSGEALAVSYFGDLPGVVVYTVESRGEGQRLVGTWTVLGADGAVFSERLTRLASDAHLPPVPQQRERRDRAPGGRIRA